MGRAIRPAPPPTTLARRLAAGLDAFAGPAQILIAERDRTGQAFLAAWDSNDARLAGCPGASHAFVESESRDWLFARIVVALKG